jgi:hypothetical protein
MVSYTYECANDYRYYDEYKSEADYWETVSDCGNEGGISSFFTQIDEMDIR